MLSLIGMTSALDATIMTTTTRRDEIKAIIANCSNMREATSGFCFEAFERLLGKREALALSEASTELKADLRSARDLAIEFGLDAHIGREKATALIARYQAQ